MVGRGAFSQCPKSISSSLSELAVCTLTGAEESNCVIHKCIVYMYNHVTNIYCKLVRNYCSIYSNLLFRLFLRNVYIGNQKLSSGQNIDYLWTCHCR